MPIIDGGDDSPPTSGSIPDPPTTPISLEFALMQNGSIENLRATAIQFARRIQTLQNNVNSLDARITALGG